MKLYFCLALAGLSWIATREFSPAEVVHSAVVSASADLDAHSDLMKILRHAERVAGGKN
jgi:hypothetical protein